MPGRISLATFLHLKTNEPLEDRAISLTFDNCYHCSKAREIFVVGGGIEIRAVRRQVIKVELRLMFLTPSAVKFGVAVFCVVGNDEHAASAFETAAAE